MNGRTMSRFLCAFFFVVVSPSFAFSQQVDRQILPVANPVLAPITEVDARKATAPRRFEVQAPAVEQFLYVTVSINLVLLH